MLGLDVLPRPFSVAPMVPLGPRFNFLLIALTFASALTAARAQGCANDDDAVWAKLRPSTANSVHWESCYTDVLCAKLTVPLDYANPAAGEAKLALVKVPAAVPANSTAYRGPILFNPGGPAESGVQYVAASGKSMQALYGDEYDIIGFDPRGVGQTEPAASLFLSEGEQLAWNTAITDDGSPNITTDAVARLYARSQIMGVLAEARGSSFAPYVSTALVARDMLSIVQALGREKLQYWGISYGSFLGMTFAAMFPDKIERMIVDGVVDAVDYVAGAAATNLFRTDAGLRRIFEACVSAGPEKCALYESDADKVQGRYQRILDSLKHNPLVYFPANATDPLSSYGLVTYKHVHAFTWASLYSPYIGTPNATEFMAIYRALEQGDASAIWPYLGASTQSIDCGSNCAEFAAAPLIAAGDALRMILCVDVDRRNDTVADLEKYFAGQLQVSAFADIWITRSYCEGWKVEPVERFRGPFTANTSFPLLFISNVDDVVLPPQGAVKMSQGFAGSSVLLQNSAGHCSIAAASNCTASAMRAYFRDGVLPKNGTVCEIESQLFAEEAASPTKRSRGGIMDAWQALASSARVPRFVL